MAHVTVVEPHSVVATASEDGPLEALKPEPEHIKHRCFIAWFEDALPLRPIFLWAHNEYHRGEDF